MPIHDWTRVEAGIFHHFHHSWIEQLALALNGGLLPEDFYAMAEQHAAGFGPDVLTLQERPSDADGNGPSWQSAQHATGVLLAPPKVRLTSESDLDFYRRKQSSVAIRHVSGDSLVAMIEVVSQGNKAARSALRSFVEKAGQLLEKHIQLLILDLHPAGPRDPQGIHGAIWEELTGEEYLRPKDKPLTLVAYESGTRVRAYVEPAAVGDTLADMPLFLEPGAHILVPLEATYLSAYAAVPRRWQRVLQAT